VSRVLAVGSLLLGGSLHENRLSTAGLTAWDGYWYALIVRSGYGPAPVPHHWSAWPFFPLLPGLAKALGLLGLPPRWGLIAVANVAFAVGLAGVWRLASRWSRRVAVTAVWVTALAPFASLHSMAYPSSLFLAASAWAFVFLGDRRYVAAGVAGAIATLARPNGIVVVVALAVAIWNLHRSADGAGRSLPSRRDVLVVCGPGIATLAVWCGLLWRWSGDPLVFWAAKRAWYEVTLVGLVQTRAADAMIHVVIGAAALTLIAAVWRHVPSAWIVFAGLYLLPSFGFGLVGLGRYAGECFPVVIAAGILLERVPRHIRPAILTTLAAAMAAFAVVVATEGIIP